MTTWWFNRSTYQLDLVYGKIRCHVSVERCILFCNCSLPSIRDQFLLSSFCSAALTNFTLQHRSIFHCWSPLYLISPLLSARAPRRPRGPSCRLSSAAGGWRRLFRSLPARALPAGGAGLAPAAAPPRTGRPDNAARLHLLAARRGQSPAQRAARAAAAPSDRRDLCAWRGKSPFCAHLTARR